MTIIDSEVEYVAKKKREKKSGGIAGPRMHFFAVLLVLHLPLRVAFFCANDYGQ